MKRHPISPTEPARDDKLRVGKPERRSNNIAIRKAKETRMMLPDQNSHRHVALLMPSQNLLRLLLQLKDIGHGRKFRTLQEGIA